MKSSSPLQVDEFFLKHASEEVRHATFFKRHAVQLGKKCGYHPTYKKEDIFAPWKSLHYISQLEIFLSRQVRNLQKNDGWELFKKRVYLLTTYGIEIRAMRIYPLYEERLNAHSKEFSLKGLILEEQSHLEDMEKSLRELLTPGELEQIFAELKAFEERLFGDWVYLLAKEGISDAHEEKSKKATNECH